jgi:hypothetical protein
MTKETKNRKVKKKLGRPFLNPLKGEKPKRAKTFTLSQDVIDFIEYHTKQNQLKSQSNALEEIVRDKMQKSVNN